MMQDKQLFDSALEKANEGQLAVDVVETRDRVIIRSAIAGVAPEDVEISVNADIVTIRGERKHDFYQQDATAHFEEVFWGTFSRSIILPVHVQPSAAEADFSNGILTLTLPKVHGEMKIKLT